MQDYSHYGINIAENNHDSVIIDTQISGYNPRFINFKINFHIENLSNSIRIGFAWQPLM